MYYNFYTLFTENEKITQIPFIGLPIKGSDKTYVWVQDDRLDIVSNKFYGDPYGGRLIMCSNGISSEDDIMEGTIINIPFPYKESLQQWIDNVKQYNLYY